MEAVRIFVDFLVVLRLQIHIFPTVSVSKVMCYSQKKIRPSAGFHPVVLKPPDGKTTGSLKNQRKPPDGIRWFRWKPPDVFNTGLEGSKKCLKHNKTEIINLIKQNHNYDTPEIISYKFDILDKKYEEWFSENSSNKND